LKNKGYSEETIKGYGKKLRILAVCVNFNDLEAVKRFIAGKLS
jgi:hypothetical protein